MTHARTVADVGLEMFDSAVTLPQAVVRSYAIDAIYRVPIRLTPLAFAASMCPLDGR